MWPTEAGAIAFVRSAPRTEARPSAARSFVLLVPPTEVFPQDFDALRIYGSGAASDGAAQTNPALNLGGFRSSSELQPYAVFGGMLNVAIDRASGGSAVGAGVLESDGSGFLRWTAPGSNTPGEWRYVSTLPVLLRDGSDDNAALRVRLTGAIPPAGAKSIRLLDQYNNAFGQDNVADAERSSGADQYRAYFLKNHGMGSLTVRLYSQLQGTARQIPATYAASGAIAVSPTGGLKDWQPSGFCENAETGEVLYYSGRSDVELNVPATGRDVFGEVAGGVAGSIGDTLHPLPGERIAKELPIAGEIQTIADESTAPTGLAWVHPVNTDDAEVVSQLLLPGEMLGIWTHRKTVASATARALVPLDVVIETQR